MHQPVFIPDEEGFTENTKRKTRLTSNSVLFIVPGKRVLVSPEKNLGYVFQFCKLFYFPIIDVIIDSKITFILNLFPYIIFVFNVYNHPQNISSVFRIFLVDIHIVKKP